MMWVCPNCGEELSDKDVNICGACGNRISGALEVADAEVIQEVTGGAADEPAAQYWSDEDKSSDFDEADAAGHATARYWSDQEEAATGYEETTDGPGEQPDDNLIPEDLNSLTEKLGDMMENGAYSPEAKEIVLLEIFDTVDEAMIVKGLLDCEGIPAMNQFNRLFVRRDDFQSAREIIAPADEFEEEDWA